MAPPTAVQAQPSSPSMNLTLPDLRQSLHQSSTTNNSSSNHRSHSQPARQSGSLSFFFLFFFLQAPQLPQIPIPKVVREPTVVGAIQLLTKGLIWEGDDGKGGRIARDETWFMSAGRKWPQASTFQHQCTSVDITTIMPQSGSSGKGGEEGVLDILLKSSQNKEIRIFYHCVSSM